MENMILEIFGYVASIIIAISLTMKNIHRLRWWNLFGAIAFSTYGVLIGAWPVGCTVGTALRSGSKYPISRSRW